MKKSNYADLDNAQIERLVIMALEERKPFEAIKSAFGVAENEVIEFMRKRLAKDKFELWRQKSQRKQTQAKTNGR